MVSTAHGKTALELANPEDIRVERDRILALRFVEKGCTKSAIREISEENPGINERTVRRAVNRQIEWAKAQKENEPIPDTDTARSTLKADGSDATDALDHTTPSIKEAS